MKIASWNVRGLARLVRECMANYQPDLILLQEIKKESMLDRLVKSAVGSIALEWMALLAIGTARGILLAWNPSVI